MNFRLGKPRESKFKYNYNGQFYNLNSNGSFDQKLGIFRAKQICMITVPDKIKSNGNFSLGKYQNIINNHVKKHHNTQKNSQYQNKINHKFKLPQIRRILNIQNPQSAPQDKLIKQPQQYYQKKVYLSLKHKQNTYMMNLARQHFIQSIQAIKVGKNMKLTQPKQIKLLKKNQKLKTIFLDLDQTLIHCDQSSQNYTVKLNFPIQGGGIIQAGIRVRPFCHQFLKQLSSLVEIVIFTASAASYADVVLDYLDPQKKYFDYRLYRHHCTLERGFFTKDLRIINRRPQDIAIVDNSAFSFMVHPEYGIPILPFYHFSKDKQLLLLLEYIKKLILVDDMREKIKQDFFWSEYRKLDEDGRKIFVNHYQKQ